MTIFADPRGVKGLVVALYAAEFQGVPHVKKLVSAVLAAALIATSASAQVSNPAGIVRNFDIANIGPVLTEFGVQWEQRTGPNNQPFIVASVNGYLFNLAPSACQGANFTQCLGVQMFSLNESSGVSQQAINAFNLRYAFLSAGPTPQGYYLSRYDIADYGIARGNVFSSISSFLSIAARASSEVAGGGQTISSIGYAEDLSASQLNEEAAKTLGIAAETLTGNSSVDAHIKAIRATPEFVNAFAASGAAGVNKIDNLTKK